MKYLFHPLTFSLHVFLQLKWVSCRQHIWILFLHPFSNSIFFNWNIKSVYIWSNYCSCVFAVMLLIDWGLFLQFFLLLFLSSFMLFPCDLKTIFRVTGFLGSWAGKESACNAGDPGLIPGLGRSAGEGLGYPFQYSWPSLVAQLVKNLPATWETLVWSQGWEDALEKGKATHSSILAWRIGHGVTVHGVTKSRTWLSNFHFIYNYSLQATNVFYILLC